ncbi:helix-turn-helix transcriptional regulator [Nocardia bovistercoris]|uniref:Helix-turn-helix domain-containing protein n=1 Tax=Nocardia bovistercoris TaxID=2785916 RepID=A0A931IEQ6_9NOCA|nr:helix-turn-helix domain-containing protein [Nocardia bovistercoris]MBH0778742.1 helix-turn-helix domain-containing protein [Nocardia bovistercoris]
MPTPRPHHPAAPADLAARRNRREDWLTTAELAHEYKFNVGTLRYWRHIGYGPASFARGRNVVYRRADVEAWIAEQEQHTRRGGTATAA